MFSILKIATRWKNSNSFTYRLQPVHTEFIFEVYNTVTNGTDVPKDRKENSMIRKCDGSLLSDSEKVMLAARVRPTVHATAGINERRPNLNLVRAILDSKLVYWNQYGYIVVAIANEKSLIIDHEYNLVTVCNPSTNMYSNMDKWVLTRWRATTGRRRTNAF